LGSTSESAEKSGDGRERAQARRRRHEGKEGLCVRNGTLKTEHLIEEIGRRKAGKT